MKKMMLLALVVSNSAFAASLEDVRVLNVIPGQGNVQLKLQTKDGPKDSYFFLDITKSDPNSFDKLAHVMKKMISKRSYQLDLEIPSFSVLPSGSYYKSDDVQFSSPSERQPNGKRAEKKNR